MGTEVGQEVVLIVEHEFLSAMEAEHGFSGARFKVSGIAATGEEAQALAKQQRPSVLVVDIPPGATALMPLPISIANWV